MDRAPCSCHRLRERRVLRRCVAVAGHNVLLCRISQVRTQLRNLPNDRSVAKNERPYRRGHLNPAHRPLRLPTPGLSLCLERKAAASQQAIPRNARCFPFSIKAAIWSSTVSLLLCGASSRAAGTRRGRAVARERAPVGDHARAFGAQPLGFCSRRRSWATFSQSQRRETALTQGRRAERIVSTGRDETGRLSTLAPR
jgi:hypothetical protein